MVQAAKIIGTELATTGLVGLIFYILIPYINITDNSVLILIIFSLLNIIKT